MRKLVVAFVLGMVVALCGDALFNAHVKFEDDNMYACSIETCYAIQFKPELGR